jgi:excisionase family DNA binding protein
MEQVFISIPISDLEDRISTVVQSAVRTALADKEPTKYYTLREAALRTSKALSTLYCDHSGGKLQGYKSGRQLRFTEDQLTAYLEGRIQER